MSQVPCSCFWTFLECLSSRAHWNTYYNCYYYCYYYHYYYQYYLYYLTRAAPPNRPPSPTPLTRCTLTRRSVDPFGCPKELKNDHKNPPRTFKRSLRGPNRSPRSTQEHPIGPQEGLKSTPKEPQSDPDHVDANRKPQSAKLEKIGTGGMRMGTGGGGYQLR